MVLEQGAGIARHATGLAAACARAQKIGIKKPRDEYHWKVTGANTITYEKSTEVGRGRARAKRRPQRWQRRERLVAMSQWGKMMSDDAHQCGCFLTGHRGLRHNDAEGAILIVEVVAGRRLIGLVIQIHQHRADAAAHSTEGNGEFAVAPAG